MKKRCVLAGAGHAHVMLLENLRQITGKGHDVTVIGPSRIHYYSGMGPGVLGGAYTPREVGFPVAGMTEDGGGTFVEDSVSGVDPVHRVIHCASGREFPYDIASFNTGSAVVRDVAEPGSAGVYPVKPIENLINVRRRILETPREKHISIAVVGGGASGLEVAGNSFAACVERGGAFDVCIYGGKHFLSHLPRKAASTARRILTGRGVRIVEGMYVEKVRTGVVRTQDGQERAADIILMAMGVRPRPLFAAGGIPTGPDGGLEVNACLQSPAFPEIFGGGDCIFFRKEPLDKVGVYAVRQNPVLLHNVHAALEGRPLQEFTPGSRDYLLIYNLGLGEGVLQKNGFVLSGRLAFWIKDYIDTRFMRRFQPPGWTTQDNGRA